jgi:hypothetical protein
MQPDRVKPYMECVMGRELRDEELSAGIAAYMLAKGGAKKKAKAMRSAIYKAWQDTRSADCFQLLEKRLEADNGQATN